MHDQILMFMLTTIFAFMGSLLFFLLYYVIKFHVKAHRHEQALTMEENPLHVLGALGLA
jgi:hypothetical protein